MEAEMMLDMRGAVERLDVVEKNDGSVTEDEYIIDCRRRRSPAADYVSFGIRQSDKMVLGRQLLSPWHDVINNVGNQMASADERNSVSVTSSLASDDDSLPPCKDVADSTGNNLSAEREPEEEVTEPASDNGTRSISFSDHSCRPCQPPPSVVGFSISDILRPDFGKATHPDVGTQKQAPPCSVRRCPSFATPVSLLPSTLRRTLVHPYTAAAAFCAAAVAAAAVQGSTVGRCPTDTVPRHDLLREQPTASRRLTSSRDVTCHVINNNNTKLRSRYAYDDKHGVVVDERPRQKASSGSRRTRAEQPSPPSNLRTAVVAAASTATPNLVVSRPDQSIVASPTPKATSSPSRETTGVDPVTKHQSSGDDSGLASLPWPAWVYCTRYSDRPSSGIRNTPGYVKGFLRNSVISASCSLPSNS